MSLSINKANYEHFKEVARIVFDEVWVDLPSALTSDPQYHPMNVLAAWELKSPALARRGLKEGLRDAVASFHHWPADRLARLDERLRAKDLPAVAKLRAMVLDPVKKVLKRGVIKNVDEFYLIKEILDDGTSDLAESERSILQEAMFKFEVKVAKGMNSKR